MGRMGMALFGVALVGEVVAERRRGKLHWVSWWYGLTSMLRAEPYLYGGEEGWVVSMDDRWVHIRLGREP